jgi:DNA end-binding protein Ku
VLTTMRFAHELVDTSAWSFPEPSLAAERELDLAMKLVESLAANWDPEKYKDEYQENLMRVIQAKLKGKQVELQEETVRPHAEVIDLMSRLQASLEKAGGARATPAGRTRTKTAAARPAARKPKSAAASRSTRTRSSKRPSRAA